MPIKFDDIENEDLRKKLEDPEVLTVIQSKIDSSVSSLNTKNQETLDELKKLRNTLNEFGGLEKIKTIISETATEKAAREKAEMDKARTEGNVKEIETRYAEQLQQKDTELNTLKSSVIEKEVKNVLVSSLNKAKGSDLLEPFIKQRVKGSFGPNGIEIEVLNENGTPMLTNKGTKATVDDLVEEFKSNQRYQTLFSGSGKSGSGTDASAGVDETFNPFDKTDKRFNLTKAMQFYKENPDKAKRLAAKVGFSIG